MKRLSASPMTHLGELIKAGSNQIITVKDKFNFMETVALILMKITPPGETAELPKEFFFLHDGAGNYEIRKGKEDPGGNYGIYTIANTTEGFFDPPEFFKQAHDGWLEHLYRHIEADDQLRVRANKRPPAAGL